MSACACVHYADIYVAFPDGSPKTPRHHHLLPRTRRRRRSRDARARGRDRSHQPGIRVQRPRVGTDVLPVARCQRCGRARSAQQSDHSLEAGWCGSARVACEDSTRVRLRMYGVIWKSNSRAKVDSSAATVAVEQDLFQTTFKEFHEKEKFCLHRLLRWLFSFASTEFTCSRLSEPSRQL